jgi:phosphoribosyl 1,2-cyclic phosphodiesterase
MTLQVRFWGVRGSCASPGRDTVEVGGNTPCVEICSGDQRLILDAGTGLRSLGNELMKRGSVETSVLLSHVHWDHIQGIPFFTPMFMNTSRIHFVSGQIQVPLEQTLRRQMSAPTFPVDFMDLPSKLSFQEVRDREQFSIGDFRISTVRANHTDPVYAYRIELGGQSVVYATDTEHYSCVDRKLVSLSKNADVLIYDAQYLPEEYTGESGMSRVGWGHSTYEAGVMLAKEAGVKNLLLFHHDPIRNDHAVFEIERKTRLLFPNSCASREGMVFEVGQASAAEAA